MGVGSAPAGWLTHHAHEIAARPAIQCHVRNSVVRAEDRRALGSVRVGVSVAIAVDRQIDCAPNAGRRVCANVVALGHDHAASFGCERAAVWAIFRQYIARRDRWRRLGRRWQFGRRGWRGWWRNRPRGRAGEKHAALCCCNPRRAAQRGLPLSAAADPTARAAALSCGSWFNSEPDSSSAPASATPRAAQRAAARQPCVRCVASVPPAQSCSGGRSKTRASRDRLS